jgi:hypothetical protein
VGILLLFLKLKPVMPLSIVVQGWLLIVFGIALWYFTAKRMKQRRCFDVLHLVHGYRLDDIEKVLMDNFRIAHLETDAENQLIIALTQCSLLSWCEQITIVFLEEGDILINSRTVGNVQPVTIVKDRLNIKRLKVLLT